MKNFLVFILALILAFALCACKNETECPAEPEKTVLPENETISEISEEVSEPNTPEKPSEPEEKIDPKSFMTFEEITSLGCYPIWMKPNTVIIYDKNGNPEIIEGGVLTEEDCAEDETYSEIGFIELNSKTYRIRPNTKVEYYKDGFIQNIYFLWPDGSYNLSPLSQTENAKITYYENIDEYENKSGETIFLNKNPNVIPFSGFPTE